MLNQCRLSRIQSSQDVSRCSIFSDMLLPADYGQLQQLRNAFSIDRPLIDHVGIKTVVLNREFTICFSIEWQGFE